MLIRLQVHDYAIIDRIDLEFGPGMTVLTGETGAGKSILVDSLALVLGERGNAQLVRSGSRRAEFVAEFDVARVAAARDWLEAHELDDDTECLLRRTIGADGRSRGFINGNAVPLSQLKQLGELLLDIHGQHFHQSLGHRSVQRDLLDYFGGLLEARAATEARFARWQSLASQLRELKDAESDRESRLDLLDFQLKELDGLGLEQDECATLERERQKLMHGTRLAEGVDAALQSVMDGDAGNANNLLAEAVRVLEPLLDYDATLQPVVEGLQTAAIHLSEASETLRRYANDIDLDPARRDWVEERLDSIVTLARKHRCEADQLPALIDRLRGEQSALSTAEARSRALQTEVDAAKSSFMEQAGKLSSGRKEAAQTFSCAVTEALGGLGMPGGRFDVRLAPLEAGSARPWGIDAIDFLISANPGTDPQPLARVASGGELSRMSLAIQVIASDGSTIPTMVFDEVDSGVGGGVAEMVGRRLRELGANRQVLCVTHLAQVASLADQHCHINKITDGKTTRTAVRELTGDERVQEIARMLGGVKITKKTLAHAAEMLAAGGARKRA